MANCTEFNQTEILVPIQSVTGHYRSYEELDY